MKRRSIGGFVTGLIGLLLGVPIGFYSYLVLVLILALSGQEILTYSVFSFYFAGIFAFIAIFFYFTKAKAGGILMMIATILYIVPFACGVYTVLSDGGSLVGLMFPLMIGNLPTILLFVSAILGLCAKAKTKISSETNNNTEVQ